MPELPEVETVKCQIKAKTKGKKIRKVQIIAYKKAEPKIKKLAVGAKIKDVKRRAKIILIELSNGYTLIVHLKLTGWFYYETAKKKLRDKFTRVVFQFNGDALLFEDIRKFGWIKIKKTREAEKFLEKKFKFGPEPFDKSFTAKKFKDMLGKRKGSKIKQLLMDQKFLAGLGNIYAQEVCYAARVLPSRAAGSLSDAEIKRMHSNIRKILKKAIKCKGTSTVDYVTLDGSPGRFGKLLKVYKKSKDPKGHQLKTVKLGGRTTKYCPKCQK